MKPADIEAGATYHNGRGAYRFVVKRQPGTRWATEPEVVWIRAVGKPEHLCLLATFARWTRGRVE